MTPSRFRTALSGLGLSQAAFAHLMGVNDRQARRWASGDSAVPQSVALLLALLVRGKISVDDLQH